MPYLDLIRFLAAFVVVLTHVRHFTFADYWQITNQSTATFIVFALTRLGHEAVIVFFVLSGYLVGGRAAKRALAKNFQSKLYAIDRASRILAPLLPAFVFTCAVAYASGELNWPQAFGNLLSLQGLIVGTMPTNGPLWSLAYEVWFYVLAGAAATYVQDGRRSALMVCLLVLTLFTRLNFVYLVCWSIGAAASFWRLQWSGLTAVLGFGTALAGVGLYEATSASHSGTLHIAGAAGVADLVIAVGISGMLPKLATFPARRLATVAATLASSSYTLYLIHYPLLVLARTWGLQPADTVNGASVIRATAALAACYFASLLFYWAFERHTPAVRSWLSALMDKVTDGKYVGAR